MHLIIAFLTAVAGVIWALYRLQNSGVDLNAFNPFYWVRRRAWEKKSGTKPLHQIDNGMEAAAVIVVATAKLEGELSIELKRRVFSLFESEFNVSHSRATEMFTASAFMLNDVVNLTREVSHIVAPSKASFTQNQVQSLLKMMDAVSTFEGPASNEQLELVVAVQKNFASLLQQAA